MSAKLASYVKFYQNNKDFIDSLGKFSDHYISGYLHGLRYGGCKVLQFDPIYWSQGNVTGIFKNGLEFVDSNLY